MTLQSEESRNPSRQLSIDGTRGAAESRYRDEFSSVFDLVLTEDRAVLERVDRLELARLSAALFSSKRIFMAGEGRSGLVVRMAAMRLMHLGCTIYVTGETITPAFSADDLLIVVSGSGSTGGVTLLAERAAAAGGRVAAVTTSPDSPLASAAHLTLIVPAASKHDRSGALSAQFAGSLFEQSTLLVFDALFHLWSQDMHATAADLWSRHTNLE